MKVLSNSTIMLIMFGLLISGCQRGSETSSPQKKVLSSLPKADSESTKVPIKPPSLKSSQANLLITNEFSPKELYLKHCSACHGVELAGNQGRALRTIGQETTEEQILVIIQQGHKTMAKIEMESSEASQLARWLSHHK